MTNITPGPWTLETVKTSCGVCHKIGPFPAHKEGEKPRHAYLYADYPGSHNPADQELWANATAIRAVPDMIGMAILRGFFVGFCCGIAVVYLFQHISFN